MIQLPEDFIQETRLLMGEERFNGFMEAFNEEAPTSIRLNTKACPQGQHPQVGAWPHHQVPWCEEGFYLEGRPLFTFDPLFHAGCYYVQEAASMFVCHVLRSVLPSTGTAIANTVPEPVEGLDMCAAPGGKSTAMLNVLSDDSLLVSNEPIPTRAQILLENITKWGAPNCIVTNNYPRDFRKAKAKFDVILCDVPCSGEGMFRKDPATIGEWSLQNVEKCWRLQREIVADAWECLNPGGILIYSTCTFNTKENEENVRWIIDTYDAEILEIPTKPEWQITGSLLAGFDAPVYRFIPGITQSEGLFMAVFRKGGIKSGAGAKNDMQRLKVLKAEWPEGDCPQVDLPYSEALKYLRGEALTLPADTPRGFVTVTYQGFPLGPAKNIGNRANNLYPKPWRIKTTHLPDEAPQVLQIVK
jgi:16S rRNA C967 or C1407 C5-methylase (RsmB/RsmF family)